jgi:dihydroorotate dehydrogenase (NAD+) catalytic subunit
MVTHNALSVRIGPLALANPVGLASGTVGYGAEYEGLIDMDRLGAIYTKAVTPEPRAGNAVPRIVETPSGILNSIGLANPGLEAFIRDKLPGLRELRAAVIVNVAGGSEGDYLKVIEGIEEAAGPWDEAPDRRTGVDGYEVNVSCPNVAHGGLSFGTDPVQVERLTAALRRATRRALIVKLTPNVADIGEIARAAEAGGADAVSAINTLVGMAIDVRRKTACLARGTGGLSGPAVRPVGLACVYRASRAVKIPVIGLGGIGCAEDALQYLLAGARAIQIGTANFVDPRCAIQTLEGIEAWMEREGVESVEDIGRLLKI